MKAKFPLYKRAAGRHEHRAGGESASGSVVALVDERYLLWLAGQVSGAKVGALQRGALNPILAYLARVAGADAPLLRTLLFTDTSVVELHDDVVPRLVPAHASDGGLALVRALGHDLVQLARHGCAWLLVASDDERLIPYVDEAQARGARVVLVADDAVHDFARLAADDPSWARLLMQADRRVAVPAHGWQALITPGLAFHAARAEEADPDGEDVPQRPSVPEPDEAWRAQVARIINAWWEEAPADERESLAQTMRAQQGIPPEADRRILMQVRRELGRNLNFPEKRLMREMVRATVLGPEAVATGEAALQAEVAAGD
ncbi:hypothetical protein [Tepidimonas charontis]|uniref:NYN domain protein n=1 Tax=Tepidimonas charontis TaxID=2267262 RepID=A0A554X7E7_9BURK|nr:hypothetical protein [Tepidimonas charontis]TSE31752.1 hypothetical protein Tchar_02232 [Tepidimonas charontis]